MLAESIGKGDIGIQWEPSGSEKSSIYIKMHALLSPETSFPKKQSHEGLRDETPRESLFWFL